MMPEAVCRSYQKTRLWDIVNAPPDGVSIHVVRAANSDRYVPLADAGSNAAETNTNVVQLHALSIESA